MSRRSAAARKGQQAAPETAQVIDLAQDGRGVAKIAGKTVFVSDALPGEEVVLVRTHRHGNYDEARLDRVVTPSPDRVVPECPHFGVCGGCVLQHLASPAQMHFKQAQLADAFERIGQVRPADWLPPLQAAVWGYRRRARLGAKWVRQKNRVVVGFRERAAPFLADLTQCPVLQSPLDRLIVPLSELLSALSLRDRIPQVEAAVGDTAVALVFRVLADPDQQDLEHLLKFQERHGVTVYLQPGDYTTVAPLTGDAPALSYALPRHECVIDFQPADFIQVNGALNQQTVDRALELLEPGATDRVLDLFCGLGNFSLPLARQVASVVAVDGDPGLIERARGNARRNGIENIQFHAANLAEDPRDHLWTQAPFNKVLLDPPRAGAREVLATIARRDVARLVYISCHPGSLARDAGILVREHGYALAAAGVMDMFPHTGHVESIALFERES